MHRRADGNASPYGGQHALRCFCCKKQGHKVQECPQKKHCACTICKDNGHCKAACPYRKRGKVDMFVETETKKEVEELGQLMLLDQIALLDRPEWTPPVCAKCNRNNPGHNKLECPEYKYCGWCRTSGSYSFINRHRCTAGFEQEDKVSDNWNEAYHELWSRNRWDQVSQKFLNMAFTLFWREDLISPKTSLFLASASNGTVRDEESCVSYMRVRA